MSTPVMLTTMGSVLLGFLFFGGSYASYMYKASPKVVWSLFAIAVVLITVVPVIIGVFIASSPE